MPIFNFNQQHFYQLYFHIEKHGIPGHCIAKGDIFIFEVHYGDDPNNHPFLAGSGYSVLETWTIENSKPILLKKEKNGNFWMS